MPEDDFDNQDQEPGRLRRMYEEEAQARAEAQARLADLERREAFRDAGLDPSNAQHRAFIKAYDGEMTPDNVNAYVDELGIRQPPPAQAEAPPPVPMDQQEALIRIAEAARDSGGMPQGTPDVTNRIRAEMEAAARRGDNTTLDRLAVELSRANGFATKWDADNRDEPSLPPGTPRMAVQTQPASQNWRLPT